MPDRPFLPPRPPAGLDHEEQRTHLGVRPAAHREHAAPAARWAALTGGAPADTRRVHR
ncbi:hypothetical protein [Geodermatophilus chilensis]|uniref:hypothetical protein n=1 Tax=Geodermatophilus chilensis TaxID=2035835 RepID=UPI0012FFD392|nr:hypothetical protein [Geodermatophilus chilensis]